MPNRKIIDLETLGYNNQRLTSLLQIQKETMPTASESYVGKTFQFIGETNDYYIHNYFYECVSDTSTIPATYSWQQINVQAGGSGANNIIEGYRNPTNGLFYEESTYTTAIIGAANTEYIDLPNNKTYRWNGSAFVRLDEGDGIAIFIGTTAEWNALTLAQKIQYDEAHITDDGGTPSPVTIVSWATGTDAEIAAMIAAADEGKINLSDYWHIGDERTVHHNAMSDSTTTGSEQQDPQDAVWVIMDDKYGSNDINFVVGMKNCLETNGYMNDTSTNDGSWANSKRRAWCNSTFKNSMSEPFRSIFKPFTVITATVTSSSVPDTNDTTNDYFALPAEGEVFGTRSYSSATEFNAVTQFEYYKTASNRTKEYPNGVEARYWLRSPCLEETAVVGYHNSFCYVSNYGTSTHAYASDPYQGITVFGCI